MGDLLEICSGISECCECDKHYKDKHEELHEVAIPIDRPPNYVSVVSPLLP